MRIPFPFTLLRRSLLSFSILSLILISLFPFLVIEPSRGGHNWNIQPVDTAGDYVGKWSSIRIDSLGRPHISYVSDGVLKYAYWNGAMWNIEVVDSSVWVWAGTSLALDGSDNPHISYFDNLNYDLRYAYWNGSGWEIEVVDSLGYVGVGSSLDIDSQGRPHMTYGINQNGTARIRYAYWDGTSWNFHDLNYSNEAGDSHLVLDSLDNPHMSFRDSTQGNVMYAMWNGSDWLVELVDDEAGSGHQNSIALDTHDEPHIAYHTTYLPTDDEVRYASWNGTDWLIETARVGGSNAAEWLSLDLDSHGNPGIAYTKPSVGDLLYIWKSEGQWYNETVDPAIGVSVNALSFTFDQMDFPHVSYCYDGETDLLHAWVEPPPLPDLTLSEWDISFDPSSPVLNDTFVNITATIHNVGGVEAWQVDVRFYDGRPPLGIQIDGDQSLGAIPPLSSATATLQWTAGPVGTHEICVFADPGNIVMEFDESNNLACRSIEVINASIPSPPSIISAHLSNTQFQDVFIEWNLSSDDSELDKYEIYRGPQYSSAGTGYSFYDWVSAGTSYYIDQNAGEGNPSDYFYYVCAVKPSNLSSCSINQAGKFTRPLSPGPNLVSTPLIQSDEDIEIVLQTVEYDKAWSYDSFSKEWKWYMKNKEYRRGLWMMNHTMGIWVNVTRDSNLTVAGVVPAHTTIHLYHGWNLVSFPSLKTTYTVAELKIETGATRVEGCNPLTPYHLRVLGDAEVLLAGLGYWVKVEADTVWTVEVS